jgi:4-diphosphocytidyl-2-C-methyl-D-erythritol kinase
LCEPFHLHPYIRHSPAKINLYLAVTGIRPSDGFHELDSLVALLDFGDSLEVKPSEDGRDHFQCDPPVLEWSSDNLIRLALELYRVRTGFGIACDIRLKKRIPLGAGLGGGSSNATTLMVALNAMNPNPVDTLLLQQWSTELGSDCALFFKQGLIRMRGRGETVESMDTDLYERLRAMRVLIFHPGFGVSAAWAYKQLRAGFPAGYTDPDWLSRKSKPGSLLSIPG